MLPFCDTPGQAAAAAGAGGLAGGLAGLATGLDAAGVAVLAGVLAGCGDIAAHVVRGDAQFAAAVERIRALAGRAN